MYIYTIDVCIHIFCTLMLGVIMFYSFCKVTPDTLKVKLYILVLQLSSIPRPTHHVYSHPRSLCGFCILSYAFVLQIFAGILVCFVTRLLWNKKISFLTVFWEVKDSLLCPFKHISKYLQNHIYRRISRCVTVITLPLVLRQTIWYYVLGY